MMDFMLYHGAQPFPDRHFGISGSHTLSLEIRIVETIEYVQGLPVQFVEPGEHIFQTICQFLTATMVSTRPSGYVFRKHPPFHCRYMPDLITDAELTRHIGPIQ